jgi:hypothetical protein
MRAAKGRSRIDGARRAESPEPEQAADPRARRPGAGAALALMTGVVVLWLVVLALILRAAALGPEEAGKVLVVFAPGTAPADAFASIVAAGGEPIRPGLGDWAWIAHGDGQGFVGRLETHGALAAFRGAPAGLTLAGCFAWITEPEVPHDPFARALAARAAARS